MHFDEIWTDETDHKTLTNELLSILTRISEVDQDLPAEPCNREGKAHCMLIDPPTCEWYPHTAEMDCNDLNCYSIMVVPNYNEDI